MVGPTVNEPGGSGQDNPIDFDDPLYIHPFDNLVTIYVIKLSGIKNFRLWRSSMIKGHRAHKKLGFVDGTLKNNKVEQTKI